MNPGTYDSVRDEAVVAWIDDATEHARADAQAKLLYCLECVRNELIQMKHEAGLPPDTGSHGLRHACANPLLTKGVHRSGSSPVGAPAGSYRR